MSNPSDKAISAAGEATARQLRRRKGLDHEWDQIEPDIQAEAQDAFGRDALEAAHDPALDLDRSVCLRDVVVFLSERWSPDARPTHPADFIKREFGGGE